MPVYEIHAGYVLGIVASEDFSEGLQLTRGNFRLTTVPLSSFKLLYLYSTDKINQEPNYDHEDIQGDISNNSRTCGLRFEGQQKKGCDEGRGDRSVGE